MNSRMKRAANVKNSRRDSGLSRLPRARRTQLPELPTRAHERAGENHVL